MVKANTILGKAAALAMLPALTLGIFAAPAAVSADNGSGVSTTVNVMNVNTGASMTDVTSMSGTGGNTIMAASKTTAGDSGNNGVTAAGARADAANDADVDDIEADGDEGSKYKSSRHGSHGDESDVDADAAATGDADALATASARTGNGGAGGKAETVSTILTGDSKSDVAVIGGADENRIDIEIDDCGCDQANTYHEESMRFLDLSMAMEYDNYYKSVEEKSKTEGDDKHYGRHHGGGSADEEWKYEEDVTSEEGAASMGLTAGESWSVSKKEYVPVTTVINVGNVNTSLSATRVASLSGTGGNTIVAMSASEAGNSGSNLMTLAGAGASAANEADVDDVEADRGDVDAAAGAHGSAAAGADAASQTGNGGAGGESTTDSLIVSGRSDSIVTVVETSRHNVVRIRR
jgi:hypothetical protein